MYFRLFISNTEEVEMVCISKAVHLERVLGTDTAKISCDQHHLKLFNRNIFDIMERSVMKWCNFHEQTEIVFGTKCIQKLSVKIDKKERAVFCSMMAPTDVVYLYLMGYSIAFCYMGASLRTQI